MTKDELNAKLMNISEVMSDAFDVIVLRSMAEGWIDQVDNLDNEHHASAKELLEIIARYDRLMSYVRHTVETG